MRLERHFQSQPDTATLNLNLLLAKTNRSCCFWIRKDKGAFQRISTTFDSDACSVLSAQQGMSFKRLHCGVSNDHIEKSVLWQASTRFLTITNDETA